MFVKNLQRLIRGSIYSLSTYLGLRKHFQRLVVEGLAIDKYPELKNEYFKHYKKVVYLAQTRSESLQNDAKKYADFLDLDYSFQYTGLDNVESQLKQAVN